MQFILEHFIELIFTALGGLLTAAYRSLAKRLRDRETESAALKEGVLSVLHDRLYQECDRYIQKGTIDASGLKNIEHLYESYHEPLKRACFRCCTTGSTRSATGTSKRAPLMPAG